jgi:hypothetical protein
MYIIPDARQTMFVAGGIASEVTAGTFVNSASAKEVQILAEDGSAVPTYGQDFFIAYKNVDGTYLRSNTIRPANIKSASVATAVTPVPTYSYFDVAIAGMAAGDFIEVMTQIYGFGTSSWHQRLNRTTGEVFVSGDTTATLSAKLGINLSETLSRTFESKPGYTVYNKAGYKAIYATEAAAESDIGSLTDGELVWVIANAKPYVVAKSGGTAFADDFDEKTDWSSEITAGTAENVLDCKYFDVVQVAGTSHRLHIICKVLSQDDERKFGNESPVYVGAQWLDKSSSDAKTDIGVTRVQEQANPGDGKDLRNWEVALDKIHRPYGRFNKMGETPVLAIDKTASYTVLTIQYYMINGNTPHQLGFSENNVHTLFIPFTSSADAATFLAAIQLTYTATTPVSLAAAIAAINLGDLADVVTAGATDGEQLTFVDSTSTWEPGTSGV